MGVIKSYGNITWTTDDEKNFLNEINLIDFSSPKPKLKVNPLNFKNLSERLKKLKNYYDAMYKRSNWGIINKEEISTYCLQKIKETENIMASILRH